MPDTIEGLPYVAATFNKAGVLTNGPLALPASVDDLIVASHGWHQDPGPAQAMYGHWVRHALAASPSLRQRRFGVVGVLWPSDKFRPDLTLENVPDPAALQAGLAASLGEFGDVTPDNLRAAAVDVARLFGLDQTAFGDLSVQAAGGGGDATQLVRELRAARTRGETADLADEHEAAIGRRSGSSLHRAFSLIGSEPGVAPEVEAGGVQAASFLGDTGNALKKLLSGPRAGVAHILNTFAYFELKQRAGTVGAALGRALDGRVPADARLHFIGHSFGARLVTAATQAMTLQKPHSLTLLQAAFSHNSFGTVPGTTIRGAFVDVVTTPKVAKRIVISHTWEDQAVGIAYAIASRASGTVAAKLIKVSPGFGGHEDKHGGLGANGALNLDAGVTRTSGDFNGDTVPAFGGELIHNRRCTFVTNHGDVESEKMGRLLAAAMA